MLNFDEIVRQLDEQIVAEAAGVPSAAVSAPGVPAPVSEQRSAAVETAPAEVPSPSLFSEMLAQNEEYRKTQSANWERREKEGKSRKTLAAVADALSSLGNLVGTAYGAFNQPQTYQMPLVQQDIDEDRALARATAERLRANDQALISSMARLDAKGNPIDILNARHQNTMDEIAARGAVNSALEQQKQQGRETLKDMYYKYKGDYDKMQAELKRQGLKIQRDRLDEAIRHNMTLEELRAQYGGGNVGGYTTQTTIQRNEYGQETGRTTTRTPAPRAGVTDTPSTTTTTKPAGKKKANPMGSSSSTKDGKKKKKNPMN